MIITKIHRQNTNSSKKFIAAIMAVAFIFLMVTAVVVGNSFEGKAADAPAESSVAEVGEQPVAAVQLAQ